jgi:phosphotransferase system  glucose/maltose/N-acetylglucosamine-specific IIC component
MVNIYFIVALLFGISVAGYLLGFTSPMLAAIETQNYANLPSVIISLLPIFLPTMLAVGAMTNFNILPIISFAILTIIMNLLIVPVVPAGAAPTEINFLFSLFWNITFTIAILAFIRGG